MSERQWTVAGLSIRARGSDELLSNCVSETYSHYENGDGVEALELDLLTDPTLPDRSLRGPRFPALLAEDLGDGNIRFQRDDVVGTLHVPDGAGTVTGQFRIAANQHSLEAAVRVSLSVAAVRHNTIILHASAVEHRGSAWVFAGKSGAGKSTISSIVGRLPGVQKLSDELLLLRVTKDGVVAFVSPFLCSRDLPHGRQVPLRSIDYLVHGPTNSRRVLAPQKSFRELMQHVLLYATTPAVAQLGLDTTLAVTSQVPSFMLSCRPTPDVAQTIGIT